MSSGEFTILLENGEKPAGNKKDSAGKHRPANKKHEKPHQVVAKSSSDKEDNASAPADKGDGSSSDKFPVFPVKGGVVNSEFGNRNDPLKKGKIEAHGGIDIPAPKGTPILAAGDGTVIVAGPVAGFGDHAVYVKHSNGLVTIYGHGSAHKVKVGQKVSAGEEIAAVGNEGHSTGDHLHFGVIKGFGKLGPRGQGIPLNPLNHFDLGQQKIKKQIGFADSNRPKQELVTE